MPISIHRFILSICISISVSLNSCTLFPDKTKTPLSFENYRIIVLLAPTNFNEKGKKDGEQQKLATTLLDKLNKDLRLPNASYRYQHICENKVQSISNVDDLRRGEKPVDEDVFTWISQSNEANCKDSMENLQSFVHLLSKEAEQHKLIIFMQIPWEKVSSSKLKYMLKKQFSNIPNRKKILKIYGFGGSGELPDISDIFEGGNIEIVNRDSDRVSSLPRKARKLIEDAESKNK
jgi:hypothetical protein